MIETLGRRAFLRNVLSFTAGGLLAPAHAQALFPDKRVVTVFHSHTGNTRALAGMIHRQVGGDLVEMEPVLPYPDDYDALVKQNVEEQRTNYWPPLRSKVDVRQYGIFFIGSPIWNMRLAPPMRSFASRFNMTGKIVVPFVTHKVSGLARAHDDIRELVPDCTIMDGLAVRDDAMADAGDSVSAWLDALKLKAIIAR